MVIAATLETPKNICYGNNNIMQNGKSKQYNPRQEHYKQPYNVTYTKVINHGFVHSIYFNIILG